MEKRAEAKIFAILSNIKDSLEFSTYEGKALFSFQKSIKQ